MSCSISHRHLWSPERLSSADLHALLGTADEVKRAKQRDPGWAPLRGRNLALLTDRSGGATPLFERAVSALGGTVTLLDTRAWQSSAGTRVADAARMLGRLYDAVDCCGLPASLLEQIDAHCSVPVLNGVAQSEHPLGTIGVLLTMREAAAKPLEQLRLQVGGDPLAARPRAAAALARLAGIHVQPRVPVAPGVVEAAGEEPDFIFDPLAAPGSPDRLTMPDASADAQARLAALLQSNSLCALQALMVCTLH